MTIDDLQKQLAEAQATITALTQEKDQVLAALKQLCEDAVGDENDPHWNIQQQYVTGALVVIARAEGR